MTKTTAFFYAAALFAHLFGLALSQNPLESHIKEAETELLKSLNALRSAHGQSTCAPTESLSKNAHAMSAYKALILEDTYFHPNRPNGIPHELTELSTTVSLGHQCNEHRVTLASAQSHAATVLCILGSNEADLQKLLSHAQYCGVSVVRSGTRDERFYWTLELSNEQAPSTLLSDVSTKSDESKLALAREYWRGDYLAEGDRVKRALKNIQNQKFSTIELILDALHKTQGHGADNGELHGVTESYDSPPHPVQTHSSPSDRSVLHGSEKDMKALQQQLLNFDDLPDDTYVQPPINKQMGQPIQHVLQAESKHDGSPSVYQAHASDSSQPDDIPSVYQAHAADSSQPDDSHYHSQGTPSAVRESPYSAYPAGPRSGADLIQTYSAPASPKSQPHPQLAPISKPNPLFQQPGYPSCPAGYVLQCTSYSTTFGA